MDHDPLSNARRPEVEDGLASSRTSKSQGNHCVESLPASASDSSNLVPNDIQTKSSAAKPGADASDDATSKTQIYSDPFGSKTKQSAKWMTKKIVAMLILLATTSQPGYACRSEEGYKNINELISSKYEITAAFALSTKSKDHNRSIVVLKKKISRDLTEVAVLLSEATDRVPGYDSRRTLDVVCLTLTKHEILLDSREHNCKSNSHKNEVILATGKWKWRKNGTIGLATQIKHAWRVDQEIGKLIEIATPGISCRIHEDRD